MTYEYKVCRVAIVSVDPAAKELVLNKHGSEGWRCLSIVHGNIDVEFVFEREIKPPPKVRNKSSKKD